MARPARPPPSKRRKNIASRSASTNTQPRNYLHIVVTTPSEWIDVSIVRAGLGNCCSEVLELYALTPITPDIPADFQHDFFVIVQATPRQISTTVQYFEQNPSAFGKAARASIAVLTLDRNAWEYAVQKAQPHGRRLLASQSDASLPEHILLDPDQKFGIELELTSNETIPGQDIAKFLKEQVEELRQKTVEYHTNWSDGKETKDAWKMVPDGSIECSIDNPNCNKFELVSPILYGERGLKEARAVVAALQTIQPKVQVNKSMGFHLHVDVEKYISGDAEKLIRISQAFCAHEHIMDQWLPKSRRTGSDKGHYFKSNRDSIKQAYHSVHQALQDCQTMNEVVEVMNIGVSHSQKRQYKLNLMNLATGRQTTVEFRQHSATLNVNKISNWVRFCILLVQHAVELPVLATNKKQPTHATLFRNIIGCPALESFYDRRTQDLRDNDDVDDSKLCCDSCAMGDGKSCPSCLPQESNEEGFRVPRASLQNQDPSQAGMAFHSFLFQPENKDVLEKAHDRGDLQAIFTDWANQHNALRGMSKKRMYQLRGAAIKHLRMKKLMATERVSESIVVCLFAPSPGAFPKQWERIQIRSSIEEARIVNPRPGDNLEIKIEEREVADDNDLTPAGATSSIGLVVLCTNKDPSRPDGALRLQNIVLRGPGRKSYKLNAATPKDMKADEPYEFNLTFAPTRTGVFRATVQLHFLIEGHKTSRVATIKRRSGDATLHAALRPTAPYTKPSRSTKLPHEGAKIEWPESSSKGSNRPSKMLTNLLQYRIPSGFRELLIDGNESDIMPDSLTAENYASYWQRLLWASEFQAKRDITLYDIENASLELRGGNYRLYVPGLAEGRPSVLKGDLVHISWSGGGKPHRYMGRVTKTENCHIVLEFSTKFKTVYQTGLNNTHVRFTLSRLSFRTCHAGIEKAEHVLPPIMLMPADNDEVPASIGNSARDISNSSIRWATRDLNSEQQNAVLEVLHGSGRPRPYIIFGPPGTGKTTTVVEAVYQLRQLGQKVLLVAPSNDATDILITKLAAFFPPSEMRRILAYTRSIESTPPLVRDYCQPGLEEAEMLAEILSSQLVVSTVNLAARFGLMGIPRGHFDVICVDEAGHATEPEVMGVIGNLMQIDDDLTNTNQLILAGDPEQLGPIIPSSLCEKFGLGISYMERLSLSDVYSKDATADNQYPSHLITKLIKSYRCHPSIMKLPNQLFYDNELVASGNIMSTHSLVKWEGLPAIGFPIVFHAMYGENCREASSPSWFNPQEAAEVANYVDNLVNHARPRIDPKDIGVITPYNRQAHKIRVALQEKEISTQDVKVGSVETFQGQERRVIIISTVRAQNELLTVDRKYNLGFVAQPNRFNVAITRAKSLLIVVGHPNVLASDDKCWLPFLRFCKENGGWTGEEWNEDDLDDDEDDDGDGNDDIAALEGEEEQEWSMVEPISQNVEQAGFAFMNREE